MVCIYCKHKTSVGNSRHQKRSNSTWRRRSCQNCKAVFTTIETIDYPTSLNVISPAGLRPFSRDKLFISVYDSLKHRKTAKNDAPAVTDTIISKILSNISTAEINLTTLRSITKDTLSSFDSVAGIHYQAYYVRS